MLRIRLIFELGILIYYCCYIKLIIGLQPTKKRAEWDLKQIFYEYHPLILICSAMHYWAASRIPSQPSVDRRNAALCLAELGRVDIVNQFKSQL